MLQVAGLQVLGSAGLQVGGRQVTVNSQRSAVSGKQDWNLSFEICLEFGSWDLGFIPPLSHDHDLPFNSLPPENGLYDVDASSDSTQVNGGRFIADQCEPDGGDQVTREVIKADITFLGWQAGLN